MIGNILNEFAKINEDAGFALHGLKMMSDMCKQQVLMKICNVWRRQFHVIQQSGIIFGINIQHLY